MPSGQFDYVPIEAISYDDSTRQRQALEGIDDLAESIGEVGLINPPVITRDLTLIAGRRRLEACKTLGWQEIPIQWSDEVDPAKLFLIELEENVKRRDLSWQEVNESVVRYHEMNRKTTPTWSQADTAIALGISTATVSTHIMVKRAIDSDPKLGVKKADTFVAASNLALRTNERQKAAGLAEIAGVPTPRVAALTIGNEAGINLDGVPETPVEVWTRPVSILTQDFLTWEPPYQFNFLHCDFPYGIDTGSKTGASFSSTSTMGTYEDSAEIYWALIDHLGLSMEKLVAPQAHMMFWFSMNFYEKTKHLLERMGWRVDPFPLMWVKSDNSGIIPDHNRGGRRTYETAFACSRGDLPIIRPVAMHFPAPSPREFHAHEKNADMLGHFFRMFVDSSTTMLDPTCGSGSSVKAAEQAGARFALGLERDEEFAMRARKNLGIEP